MFSFSNRLIFDWESCRNLSPPGRPASSGPAVWAAWRLLLLSIWKARRWASLYTSTNWSPASGLQRKCLASGLRLLPSTRAAMHRSRCPTGPKKTSSSSFALFQRERTMSHTGVEVEGLTGRGYAHGTGKKARLFTLEKTTKDRSRTFRRPEGHHLGEKVRRHFRAAAGAGSAPAVPARSPPGPPWRLTAPGAAPRYSAPDDLTVSVSFLKRRQPLQVGGALLHAWVPLLRTSLKRTRPVIRTAT